MRYLIGVILSLFSTLASAYNLEVVRVVDGDTVQVFTPIVGVPELGKTILIRIVGIDAPESTFRAKCDKERLAGQAAKNYLMSILPVGSTPKVNIIAWDKYGGRVLGTIEVGNKDVSTLLIKNGYARQYDGGTKSDWCTK